MARMRRLVAVLAICGALVGCGSGDDDETSAEAGTSASAFAALTGQDVIEATRAEQTAAYAIRDHGDPADPGTDHGTSGLQEQTFELEGAFDFARNRSVTRTEFSSDDFSSEEIDIKIEVRIVDGTSYTRDGSWLCPGCALDGDPLPSDMWITNEEPASDVAFSFGGSSWAGQLAWIALVEEKVEPGATSELPDGTSVAEYRTEISVDDVNAAVREADPNNEYAPVYQGESVAISFKADAAGRLRELVVDYHVDDRAHTLTATLEKFGEPVEIEVPPPEEIFEG